MTKLSRDLQKLVERRGLMRARDGAVVDPVVDDANGVQWFFKYRKNAPGKYKWFAIGQQNPLFAVDVTNRAPTPINTANIVGASVVIPFSGMYLPVITHQSNGSAICTILFGTYYDGVSLNSSWNVTIAAAGANVSGDLTEVGGPHEFTAGHSLQNGFSTNVLGATILANNLKLFPYRILI